MFIHRCTCTVKPVYADICVYVDISMFIHWCAWIFEHICVDTCKYFTISISMCIDIFVYFNILYVDIFVYVFMKYLYIRRFWKISLVYWYFLCFYTFTDPNISKFTYWYMHLFSSWRIDVLACFLLLFTNSKNCTFIYLAYFDSCIFEYCKLVNL